jgi:hypothetical protein
MNKEKLIEQLKLIQDKKQKAATAQSYELASSLRNKEKEILHQLEALEQ